jgi:hypothetical protein
MMVQLLVFLGRPEPLAELGLHAAAAAAGEPSHSLYYSDDDGRAGIKGTINRYNGDDRSYAPDR